MTTEDVQRTTVSVALCTHNGADYIEQQVRSILSGTLLPTEIVISDDASTDGTVEVVEELILEDPRAALVEFRIIRNEVALGVTANFESALAACTGDLVALCDQDDVWHPSKFERMSAVFAARPGLLLAHSDARMVDGDGRPLGATLFETLGISATELEAERSGRAFEVLLRRNIVTGATVVLRRDLIARARPFPVSWVHDEWLAIIAAVFGELDAIEEPLIDYRQHARNQIGASRISARTRIARLTAPRAPRNARLLARAAALDEWCRHRSLGVAVERAAAEKLEHERVRSSLPGSRFGRIAPIVREWRIGRYQRYGLGIQDVLRDLVQPAE